MRLMYMNRRRPFLVDMVVTPVPGGLAYELWGGNDMDPTGHALKVAFGPGGFKDDTINGAVLETINLGQRIRVVFDPSAHGMTDTEINFVQLKADTGGGMDNVSPVTMLLPDTLYHGYETITLHGFAPQGATPADAVPLDLSRLARDLRIVNQDTTNGLYVGFNDSGHQVFVPAGAEHAMFTSTFSSLYVRGVGGVVEFSASFTHAMRLPTTAGVRGMRALVLSGGGSKGAYQVGALAKWLGEDRIEYDILCGTSVGAINAAFLAQFGPGLAEGAYDSLERLWRQVTDERVWQRWFPLGRVEALWKPAVYDSTPVLSWLKSGLNPEAIRTSGKKLRVSAVAWDTAEVHVATETADELEKWVAASASYPVMFLPVEIGGRLWSDGGLRSNTPLGEAIRLGADEVDVILCNNPDILEPFDPSQASAIPGFLVRTLDIQSAQIQLADLAVAGLKNDLCELKPEYRRVKIRLLMPTGVLADDPLRFEPGAIARMMDQGYADASRLGSALRFFLWPRLNEGRRWPPQEKPMLRLIHNQTITGAILVDDIDDGLPNKTAQRLGGTADPKAYRRDGYANYPKQSAYIPRLKPTDVTLPGYIDLNETPRVTLSAGKGKIKKLQTAGLITVVSFNASDLSTPTLATAAIDTPGAGDLTLTGTFFVSLSPNITKVLITGTGGPLTLTQSQITLGGGTISNTSIFIPAALVPGIAAATTSVRVQADDKLSPLVAVS